MRQILLQRRADSKLQSRAKWLKSKAIIKSRAKLTSRAEQHLCPNKLKTNFSKVNSSEVENKVKVNV